MKDLEELKKEAIAIKRKSSTVSLISTYQLVSILRLREVYSKSLHIEPEDVFINVYSIRFFSILFTKKREFDVDSIRLDILSGMSIPNIAMKYQEPEYVIQEIKDNRAANNNTIIKSKIYTVKELVKTLKISKGTISVREDFRSISEENDVASSIIYWRGSLLLENINKLVLKTHKPQNGETASRAIYKNNIKYIPFAIACEMLKVRVTNILYRLKKNEKIFGVTIEHTLLGGNDSPTGYRHTYCKEADVLLALKNKKYYIEIKKVFSFSVSRSAKFTYLKRKYKNKYNKEINLLLKFMKKETADRLLEISRELGYC